MLDWLRPKSTRMERGLAWRTQMVIATCAPFSAASSPRKDPDSVVGEAVFNSDRMHEMLMELAYDLDPRRPLKATAESALASMSPLLALRLSWLAYCNETFSLNPDATDARSEMRRQWVAGDKVRSWRYFDQAKAALAVATERIAELQPELADFCGRDITTLGRKAA